MVEKLVDSIEKKLNWKSYFTKKTRYCFEASARKILGF